MTLQEARLLRVGDHLVSKTLTNSTGKIRVKVNGKPQVWKRRPEAIRIPYKYGLYEYGYLREGDLSEWGLAV